MTLFDSRSGGVITAVGGDDGLHRRLVDLGLIGCRYAVKAKRFHAVLVDLGDFRASFGRDTAKQITVIEG